MHHFHTKRIEKELSQNNFCTSELSKHKTKTFKWSTINII